MSTFAAFCRKLIQISCTGQFNCFKLDSAEVPPITTAGGKADRRQYQERQFSHPYSSKRSSLRRDGVP